MRGLYADYHNVFLHDVILDACTRFAPRTAIIDTSLAGLRGQSGGHITYGEYGPMVERLAKGMVGSGIQPGDVIGIYLPNSWEFCAAYHAATLAGAIPMPMNPSYREREVRYQLENSGAAALITDSPQIEGMDLKGLPALRTIYCTRKTAKGAEPFAGLLRPHQARLPKLATSPAKTVAALPYSSGTTGLPKGVMLSHTNLVANIYQFLAPGEACTLKEGDVVLQFLPLYHIYGLNVVLNPAFVSGATLILMPRFDADKVCALVAKESVTWLPVVPPAMNALCHAAEEGKFPKTHKVRFTKCGAAPLADDLPRRYTELTGIPVKQGYGMTEAAPVTHMGYIEPELYNPTSIGQPVAETDCRIVDESGKEVPVGEVGELVMRGPQFMLGYWNSPEATADVVRPLPGAPARPDLAEAGYADRWYFSGDIARRDDRDFYYIVDRRKEMIKFKGFAIAPAEVEAILLEHPRVRDCGVVAKQDAAAGEVPCAFVVLREGGPGSDQLAAELSGFVAQRLTTYKQPREIRFVANIPRNPSGKILRRELRKEL